MLSWNSLTNSAIAATPTLVHSNSSPASFTRRGVFSKGNIKTGKAKYAIVRSSRVQTSNDKSRYRLPPTQIHPVQPIKSTSKASGNRKLNKDRRRASHSAASATNNKSRYWIEIPPKLIGGA